MVTYLAQCALLGLPVHIVQVILRPFCCSVASFIAVVIAFVASCILHAISCIVASCMLHVLLQL